MALKKRTIRKITKKTVTRTVRRTIVRAANLTPVNPKIALKTYTTDGRVVKVTPLKSRG